MTPRRVVVLFGGRSSEHEISCLSARSVIDALEGDDVEVVPIGIARDGRWFVLPGPPALPPQRRAEVLSAPGLPAQRQVARWVPGQTPARGMNLYPQVLTAAPMVRPTRLRLRRQPEHLGMGRQSAVGRQLPACPRILRAVARLAERDSVEFRLSSAALSAWPKAQMRVSPFSSPHAMAQIASAQPKVPVPRPEISGCRSAAWPSAASVRLRVPVECPWP